MTPKLILHNADPTLVKGRVFYGMHMAPGIAEYKDPKRWTGKVLVNEEAMRRMDPSAGGCPMFCMHRPTNQDTVSDQSVGWVLESFFNKSDGRHWIKFVITDKVALDAIDMGWTLSNAYQETEVAPGGSHQGQAYDHEVMNAEYVHFALVPDARYESKVLTPEEFKSYNAKKESELLQLANAADEESTNMGLADRIFKKTKVESVDENAIVRLKSGEEKTLLQLVNWADEQGDKEKQNMDHASGKFMANAEHLVEFGGEKMSVNALMEKCNGMSARINEFESKEKEASAAAAAKQNAEDEEKKKKEEEEAKAKENSTGAADPIAAAAALAKKSQDDAAAAAATEETRRTKLLEMQNAANLSDVKVLESLSKGSSGTFSSPEARIARGKELF